jgi:type I restriction enzyme S subunit
VRSAQFVKDMTMRATGASYPAVTDGIIKDSKIPLPPLPEQRRIATILVKADSLREKRRLAITKLDELLKSVFIEMFGDPVTNPKGWQIKTIGNTGLIISDGNYAEKYPRTHEFLESGVPFVRANNIRRLTVVSDDLRFISEEKHQELRKGHLKVKDILITTRGDIGNVALVPVDLDDANINAQLVLLRSNGDQINPVFLLGH